MNLDEIDLLIIKNTLLQQKLTSTEMAKKIFNTTNQEEIKKKDLLIRKRAKKLLRYGLLERIIKNNISYWNPSKAVFADIPIYVDGKKIKFLGVIIKVNNNYVIHGINE